MSLRRAVAAPFRQRGVDRLTESEFVVALSLDRDWFSPDQAQRLVDVATGEGLLDREDDDIVATFDTGGVDVPDGFVPDESVLQQRSTFERVLDALVDAGVQKQEAVAEINRLQADLGLAIEAAAVLYARRQGLDVTDLAATAREDL
ncbi:MULTISPECIES: DUF2240 family protein [Salinibaculum]|uniref:DUF2240 family protein n=1 Tax=Salinibaculum TaxID=2732368 RepID=UPI0030D1ABFA